MWRSEVSLSSSNACRRESKPMPINWSSIRTSAAAELSWLLSVNQPNKNSRLHSLLSNSSSPWPRDLIKYCLMQKSFNFNDWFSNLFLYWFDSQFWTCTPLLRLRKILIWPISSRRTCWSNRPPWSTRLPSTIPTWCALAMAWVSTSSTRTFNAAEELVDNKRFDTKFYEFMIH